MMHHTFGIDYVQSHLNKGASKIRRRSIPIDNIQPKTVETIDRETEREWKKSERNCVNKRKRFQPKKGDK